MDDPTYVERGAAAAMERLQRILERRRAGANRTTTSVPPLAPFDMYDDYAELLRPVESGASRPPQPCIGPVIPGARGSPFASHQSCAPHHVHHDTAARLVSACGQP